MAGRSTVSKLEVVCFRCVLSRASESYDILPTEVPGRAEQWPSTWTDAAFSVAARALDSCDRASVRAIGVSGQQHTLVNAQRAADHG